MVLREKFLISMLQKKELEKLLEDSTNLEEEIEENKDDLDQQEKIEMYKELKKDMIEFEGRRNPVLDSFGSQSSISYRLKPFRTSLCGIASASLACPTGAFAACPAHVVYGYWPRMILVYVPVYSTPTRTRKRMADAQPLRSHPRLHNATKTL